LITLLGSAESTPFRFTIDEVRPIDARMTFPPAGSAVATVKVRFVAGPEVIAVMNVGDLDVGGGPVVVETDRARLVHMGPDRPLTRPLVTAEGILRPKPHGQDPRSAQKIVQTPVDIYGSMDKLEDTDVYRIEARAGEQLSFDLRATDIGSALECKLVLLDANHQIIAQNDDRDVFDDTPYFQHTFRTGGTYYLKIDQYRGPRSADGKNNTYIPRLADLPRSPYGSLLGAKTNSKVRVTIAGTDLQKLDGAYLSEVRLAEYYRMTYPYVMPLHIRPDPANSAANSITDTVPLASSLAPL